MTVVLACTWEPRGEMSRFERFFPMVADLYQGGVVVSLRSEADLEVIKQLDSLGIAWSRHEQWYGRHNVLRMALETGATHIHYCDFDRLVRWVELYADSLPPMLDHLQTVDCLVIGRTDKALKTHPEALNQTEKLINMTFSHFLGSSFELCSGARGFSREAAAYVLKKDVDGNAYSMEAAWTVLLQRAGYKIEGILVDSLDWESADQHQETAADPETQQRLADEYDAKVESWQRRVNVAHEVIELGLKALRETEG